MPLRRLSLDATQRENSIRSYIDDLLGCNCPFLSYDDAWWPVMKMKAFALFTVALAALSVVSAQIVTFSDYNSPNCTGPLRNRTRSDGTRDGPENPRIQPVGLCGPASDSPVNGTKIVSCDAKAFIQRRYVSDTGLNTSSCKITDPSIPDHVVDISKCIVEPDKMDRNINRSTMITCTMPSGPGVTGSTSGSGPSINIEFFAFSFLLISLGLAFM